MKIIKGLHNNLQQLITIILKTLYNPSFLITNFPLLLERNFYFSSI